MNALFAKSDTSTPPLSVYATSLGYLDFCIGAYTITSKRAAFADFFETTDNGLYLITFVDSGGTSWDVFRKEFLTVFQPFEWKVWMLIMFFFIPALSILMLTHEYGAPGSAYPRTVPVLVQEDGINGQRRVRERPVPIIKHIVESIYVGILAFFHNTFSQGVVTVGGKIHLLAIASFVMMVYSVYTANLAAILTQDIQRASPNSVKGVINAGYRVCAERKVSEIITKLYSIDREIFIPDPVDQGGDGLPGFNCPECAARTRIFDFMKQDNKNSDLYCDVAIASLEDLEVLQSYGEHCNKTRIGDVLAHQSNGIPIYSDVSKELISLFHELENDGYMKRALNDAQPESTCPERTGEGTALTLQQMTGIWITTCSFALLGLVVKLFWKNFYHQKGPIKERTIQRYDQWKFPTGHSVIIDGQQFDPGSFVYDTSPKDQIEQHSQLSILGGLSELKEDSSSVQDINESKSDAFDDDNKSTGTSNGSEA
uniref:Ionotropic glutamate receptor C-terminal domain-containing protein n=1 Tax=Ditylum brightwellii TaxID=49249 RepID=A0A7S4UM90_9STRA